jgi:hypothetical protein
VAVLDARGDVARIGSAVATQAGAQVGCDLVVRIRTLWPPQEVECMASDTLFWSERWRRRLTRDALLDYSPRAGQPGTHPADVTGTGMTGKAELIAPRTSSSRSTTTGG